MSMMNQADLIPISVRDEIAWIVLETPYTVAEAARRFSVPLSVVSDAVEGFLRDAREFNFGESA